MLSHYYEKLSQYEKLSHNYEKVSHYYDLQNYFFTQLWRKQASIVFRYFFVVVVFNNSVPKVYARNVNVTKTILQKYF